MLSRCERGAFVFHDDGNLALLQPLLGLPPVKILLTGQSQLLDGVFQPLHIGLPVSSEVVDQLLRGVFPIRHVGGDHGKTGQAASIGGDGSAAVLDVGVVGLKKQGNRVVGDGFRLCLGYGRFLGFRRKGFHKSGGFGDSGLCFRALPPAGAEHCGHQREGKGYPGGVPDMFHWADSCSQLCKHYTISDKIRKGHLLFPF